MDFGKLFRVLVIGGSILGCGSTGGSAPLSGAGGTGGTGGASPTGDGETDGDGGGDLTPAPEDAALVDLAPGDAGPSDAGSGEAPPARQCFCNVTPSCCTAHEGAPSTPAPGIECCWGTMC